MTKFQHILRGALFGLVIAGLYLASGQLNTAQAQRDGDPFRKQVLSKKYLRANKPAEPAMVTPPTIEERIQAFRAAKVNAMNAGAVAPKPTTILLLSEVEVTGIFHTPRGYAAMVEATPLTTTAAGKSGTTKLSYVVYPGESFYDGQLVAIEEGRLVFRKFVTWTSGRKDKVAEVKNLRVPNAVTDGLQAARTTEGATDAPKPGETSHAPDPTRQQ